MDALIAIPDLDDDTIYPLDAQTDSKNEEAIDNRHAAVSQNATAEPGRARPFRGAELKHSRSGSAISFDSSTGSRTGGMGAAVPNAAGRGALAGGVAFSYGGGVTATPNVSATPPSFPRKGSFASLKAAFKGPSVASPQDAYPPQLRNPFTSSGNAGKASNASLVEAGRAHGRNDSYVSSATSRSRTAHPSSQRHFHQSSLYSENSMGASTSLSESTTGTGSGFRNGHVMPPMPPFPEAYINGAGYLNGGQGAGTGMIPPPSTLPPARTAYARSMSAQDPRLGLSSVNATEGEAVPIMPRPTGVHDRTNSVQSSLEHHDNGSGVGWMHDVAIYPDLDGPLQPPQPNFAGSWHQRGSSGGSRATSEDGTRPSFDQQSSRGAPRQMGATHGMPPVRSDRSTQRPQVMMSDNTSVATLPTGIGLDDPLSPAEYAINVLCSRFLTLAGVRIRTAIGGVDESDPSLERALGRGADAALDTLLDSLAHVSRKNPAPVVKSMFQWRDNMMEDRIDVGDVRGALAGSQAGLSLGVRDVANVLMRRKTLSTAYLLARSLIQIASGFVPGPADVESSIKGLNDAQVSELQSRAFDLMRECSRERFPASRMQSDAFDNAARLLGILSKVSFTAVGDRFVAFLEQSSRTNSNAKEGDISIESTVAAIRHLTITSFPMELFEEGAEFLEIMARNFAAAHGQRLKSTYAESLAALLLPVAKSASAELHHPTWAKALDSIAPRAFAMLTKPRYWSVAYPLYVAVLCASPEDRFLQPTQGWSWVQCLEAGVAKLGKDRTIRTIVQNAAVLLLWTYLFRCRESSSTTTKRLENYFRSWFPANRANVFPSDVSVLDWHIYMTHYTLYRQFDFGRDLVLDFLRAKALSSNTLSLQPDLLSKQRMTIAVRAILLTLDAQVREASPSFPADAHFDAEKDGLGDELPESFTYPTPDIGATQAQFNDLIGKVALLCNHQVGPVSIFDDQVTLTRSTSVASVMSVSKGTNDEEKLCWRLHSAHRFVAAYNKEHQPFMDLLRACIDSWPRCLSANVQFSTVLTVLHRAYFSADPLLADAAARCLTRIAEQRKGGANAVVSSFMKWILRVDAVYWETHPNQTVILSKIEDAVKLLVSFLDIWLTELKKGQASATGKKGWEMERTSAWATIDEVEAIGLFLLCSAWRPLRRHAIGILRIVSILDGVFEGNLNHQSKTNRIATHDDVDEEDEPTRIIHLLNMPCSRFIQASEDLRSEEAVEISAWQKSRTKKWKRAPSSKETLSDLAESDKSSELTTWFLVVPRFLRMCLDHFPTSVAVFRSIVTNRILGMESAVSAAAGTSNRAPAGTISTLKGQAVGAAGALMPFTIGNAAQASVSGTLTPEQNLMAEHWKMYILALCTTTTSIEGSAHRIMANEGPSTERVIAAKDLFQKLVPYLASDHARFRDAVVSALGNINTNLYKTLLETLQTVNAQLSEDFRRSTTKRNRQHERLRTALAHVIQLTSPHMTHDGALSDSNIVFLILQWIKETFNFLTDRDIRLNWEFHRLRRFFAGVAEVFFDALYKHSRPGNETAERFLTFETKLRMFRMFRDWHSFSQAAKDGPAKLANLLAGVAEQYREDRNREAILTMLRNETQLLSFHASSAMAALCQGVIAVADRQTYPTPMSLEPGSLIEWLKHLFLSPSPQNHVVARRALKALMTHNSFNTDLIRLALEHAFAEPEQTTASRSFFAVFADVVVEKGASVRMPLTLPQILCLGLVKLGHPDVDTRKKAFLLLSSVTPSEDGMAVMQAMEGGVSSPLPATYLRAQRDISTLLAEQFQEHKIAMLSEYALRLPEIDLSRRATTLGLLPEWLHRIAFISEPQQDGTGVVLSRRATLVLSNLLAMTIRYGDEHNFEIQDMWASLAEGDDYAASATTIVKFLIQQALALRSSAFIMHAKRAVSCLSHTVLAPTLFAELCSYIEPSSMIPVPLEISRLAASDPQLDHLYLASIEAHLPPPSRRQTFSPGQVALLFVGELTYDKTPLLVNKLPLLLHAIFMQVDSMSAFTQEQVMCMFEQLMRSLSSESGQNSLSTLVERLFDKGTSIFWTQDEADFDASQTPRVMRNTVLDTLVLIKHHVENVNEQWGNVALYWATSNPVRHMACRSFQMFRILLPEVNYSMLADMLGRLSNTISDSTRIDNQSFALEILYTMKAIVRNIDQGGSEGAKRELLGHVFWMNVACLSTVNEAEFGQAVDLMQILLERLDLDSSETVALLKAQCPDGWEGEIGGLQNLVMRGLRSAALSDDSFNLLARMAKISNDRLIDGHDSRVGYLFMISLPWFLQATDEPGSSEEMMITALAEDIARLASTNGKADIERVATSIAKKRFRTKDDLIRQAVGSCVRAGFLPNHATGMALTLLTLTFNARTWLRKQTLQVLKIFFQSVDTRRQEFHELGPELLMPLLRLLSTDLSMEALEVLEEKILASTSSNQQRRGPNAHQILRMSLQWHHNSNAFPMRRDIGQTGPDRRRFGIAARHGQMHSDADSSHGTHESNSLFGLPEESGWSVADIPDWTSRTRINILSVFKSVELLLDTPPVGEVNFVDDYDAEGDNVFEQNMTASRVEAEEMESVSIAPQSAARSAGSVGGVLPPEQASFASNSSINASTSEAAITEDDKVNIGDIVSQLHDLSSFFIDDELTAIHDDANSPEESNKSRSRRRGAGGLSSASTRLTHFWNGSTSSHGARSDTMEENGEQVAKILGRSALASMMGRAAGGSGTRVASEGSDGTRGTPTPGDPDGSTTLAASTSGTSVDEGTSSKRGSMWVRKSIFGGRRVPAMPARSTSETVQDGTRERPLSPSSMTASTSLPSVPVQEDDGPHSFVD